MREIFSSSCTCNAERVYTGVAFVQEFRKDDRISNTSRNLPVNFFAVQAARLLKEFHISLNCGQIWYTAPSIAKSHVRLGRSFRQAFASGINGQIWTMLGDACGAVSASTALTMLVVICGNPVSDNLNVYPFWVDDSPTASIRRT